MRKKINLKLFSKYYWGIATDNETDEVFDSDESNEMLKEKWDDYSDIKSKFDKINHEKITREINRQLVHINNRKTAFNRISNFVLNNAAAIFIPLIAISTVFILLVLKPGIINHVAMIEKTNPRGQRSELLLPDGTKVWLNADSKISFPEEFTGKNRMVNLTGEAFFDVVKNPDKPFIVKTNSIEIEVLGTSFNVSAYSNDNYIKTTLVTGKVSIKRLHPKTQKTQKAILTPNHQAVFYKSQEKFVLDKVDVDKFTSWKQGVITFDNEPLYNVIKVLERWYDVEFKVDKRISLINNYTLTVTDESLDEVIKLIEKTTPAIQIVNTGEFIEIQEKQ